MASDNHKVLNQIYNLEDFYENNLLPKMFAFPSQYISRLAVNRNNGGGQGAAQGKRSESKPNKENNKPSPSKRGAKKLGVEDATLTSTPAKGNKPNSKKSSEANSNDIGPSMTTSDQHLKTVSFRKVEFQSPLNDE